MPTVTFDVPEELATFINNLPTPAARNAFATKALTFQQTMDSPTEQRNARRVALIFQQEDTGLTLEEKQELEELQRERVQTARRHHPLPFDKLSEAESLSVTSD